MAKKYTEYKQKKSLIEPLLAIKNLFQKPITVKIPAEKREVSPRYRGFHTNDLETCIGCGNCSEICPTSAITMVHDPSLPDDEPGRKPQRPWMDYGRCCFCALCVDVCPSGSLSMTKDFVWTSYNADDFYFMPDNKGIDNKGWQSDPETSIFHHEAVPVDILPSDERKKDFVVVTQGYDREKALAESMRCMECDVCRLACPAQMKIGDYIREIYFERYDDAVRIMLEDNPLSGVCGTICTHRCQDNCAISLRGDSLSIMYLKGYAVKQADYNKLLDELKPEQELGKKIAIIGAGPSGLSCAFYLRKAGFSVDIYEKNAEPGGMVRYGIPSYRLPNDIIGKDVKLMQEMGVNIKLGVEVGKDIEFEKLTSEYDAVYIACGLQKGMKTGIANEDAEGVWQAVDFLGQIRRGEDMKVGKKIIVIGGGNVAMDAARSAVRLQMKQHGNVDVSVICLEDFETMPAFKEEIEEAMEEGVKILPCVGVPRGKEGVLVRDGKVSGFRGYPVKALRDAQGRFNPQFDENAHTDFEADMIIEAVGQGPDFSFVPESIQEKMEKVAWRFKVDENYMTSVKGVFAGGDIWNARRDAISAIADGKKAAEGIARVILS